jgi:hypothetical protein
MSKKYPATKKGTATTPRGYMSASALKVHGLKENVYTEKDMIEPKELRGSGHRKSIKKLVEAMRAYRLAVHKVTRPHLARTLVLTARYFLDKQKAPQRNQDKSVDNTKDDVEQVFAVPAQIG